MTYQNEVYVRFYSCFVSLESWCLWFLIFFFIGICIQICSMDCESEDKEKMFQKFTKIFFISLATSFIVRVILWIFLPTPVLVFGG